MLKNHITISLKCFTLTVVYLIKLFNVNWLIRHIEWHFLWIDKQDYFLGKVNDTEKHHIWTFAGLVEPTPLLLGFMLVKLSQSWSMLVKPGHVLLWAVEVQRGWRLVLICRPSEIYGLPIYRIIRLYMISLHLLFNHAVISITIKKSICCL